MSKIMDAIDELVKIYFDRKFECKHELAVTFLNVIKPLAEDRCGGSISTGETFLLPDGCDGHLYERASSDECSTEDVKIDIINAEIRNENQNDIIVRSLRSGELYLMDCNEDVIRSMRFQEMKRG